jgi:hypothetical protein
MSVADVARERSQSDVPSRTTFGTTSPLKVVLIQNRRPARAHSFRRDGHRAHAQT